MFSRAATFLALSASVASAQDLLGGFQSGPSEGAFYSGGMSYIPNLNRAFFTGAHYNEEIMPKEITAGDKMTGVARDSASNCYLAKMDFYEEENNGFYNSMSEWISFGNPGRLETCSAVAATGGSDVFVVGSVADGGIFSDGYPMQGLLSILDKDTLEFIDATLIKSAEDPSKHMIYPLDAIHDYHRKFVYIAALTSRDDSQNPITGNQKMPNWQEQHLLGSGFDVTVIKIRTPDGEKPIAKWVQHFPLDVQADGTTPPVFVAGMALQTDTNGLQHLLISGSTRGSGEAFGDIAPNSVDEDGFVMQLKLSDGTLIKTDRHEGQSYEVQDDLREGTGADDFIRGMCNNLGKGHEGHRESDVFYIVGGTKGDMTNNYQGKQDNTNGAGMQIGSNVNQKYKDVWNRDESLQPFLRKVNISTLKPEWTTQWIAAPATTYRKGIPTNAYAMDCYVNVEEQAVFVVGSVLEGAKMTQGDVELINQGSDDIWVAKIDELTGAVLWITQLGTENAEYLARHGSIAVNNDGNVLIYGDTNGSLYRFRGKNENNDNTDMFVMTIDGTTGAVIDESYLGGTSSAIMASGGSHTVATSPPKNNAQIKDENRINNAHAHAKAGTLLGIVAGVLAGLFLLYLLMMRNMKKRRAEAQKSSIFAALQQFDVEDIDLRRSPPGGWHGTYMNKLAYGQNNADGMDVDSSAEGGLFKDDGTKGGYKDNFSIDDEDDVDVRLKGANRIV